MDTLGRAWRLGQSGSAWGTLLLDKSVKLRIFQAGRLGRVLVHASNLVIISRAYSTVRQRAKWVVLATGPVCNDVP